jgi:copper chaperone CopZ
MIATMREALTVEQIRCEKCVAKLAAALAPIKGLHDARIEIGRSVVVVEHDDDEALRTRIATVIEDAGYVIVEREARPALVMQ